MKDLLSIASRFDIQGTIGNIKPLGSGLINDTYKVTTVEETAPDYVLQRINHTIFQNVDMLQANIKAVTEHIRKKLEEKGETDIDRKVLNFIPNTDDGKTYWYDGYSYQMPRPSRLSTRNIHIMQDRHSAISRRCSPTSRRHSGRQSRISIIWNSGSDSCAKP